MNDKAISILSTRPLDGALIEKAAFLDIHIDIIPFIEIKKSITAEVQNFINDIAMQHAIVVFTSMNAVEVLVDALPKEAVMPPWKIYCLGGATFTLVKKYWTYESIVATAKNATELAEKITAANVRNITFFCGNKRREELPGLLKQNNISVTEATVYETIEITAKTEKEYKAILFFSPSAVSSFFIENTVSAETTLFAIGNTTANAIKQFCNNNIIISDFPAKDQLVEKALNFFKKKPEVES